MLTFHLNTAKTKNLPKVRSDVITQDMVQPTDGAVSHRKGEVVGLAGDVRNVAR
jgi:hypothetical protein